MNTAFNFSEKKLSRNIRSIYGWCGMLVIVIGWYMFGPMLSKDSWEQLRYRLKTITEKIRFRKHIGILGKL